MNNFKLLNSAENYFDELADSCLFETAGTRKVSILVKPNVDNSMPLVRTMLKVNSPAQYFSHALTQLIDQIKIAFKETHAELEFNSAKIEIYTHAPRSLLGFRVDTSGLDLQPDSAVCLFSCYNKQIESSTAFFGIPHNSAAIFAPKQHIFFYPIPLTLNTPASLHWMSITLKLSKTFVDFSLAAPRLLTENRQWRPLCLATQKDYHDLNVMKCRENNDSSFEYPPLLAFTISPGDLLKPSSPIPEREIIYSSPQGNKLVFGIVHLNAFDNFFYDIERAHTFYTLSSSSFGNYSDANKQTNALRKGVFLTPVTETPTGDLTFHLMRCSTNINGPTENFKSIDHEILKRIKHLLSVDTELKMYDWNALNHVLAQIYCNTSDGAKAAISPHSDKTNDMPIHGGLIVFCTFYKGLNKLISQGKIRKTSDGDFVCKMSGVSVLTKLRFRSKQACDSSVDVVLKPNSMLSISLLMNCFYTHEIVPSEAPISSLPVRIGYVVRCSTQEAIFRKGRVCLPSADGEFERLRRPTWHQLQRLKKLYLEQNRSVNFPDYSSVKGVSVNEGDFLPPKI